jgi:YD repeat-containing protein
VREIGWLGRLKDEPHRGSDDDGLHLGRGPAGLPVVLQDGTNTYVYGLDLISSTDGSGDQTYFTYDGLGSTADLTDDEGDVVDGYTYDVFGAVRGGGARLFVAAYRRSGAVPDVGRIVQVRSLKTQRSRSSYPMAR